MASEKNADKLHYIVALFLRTEKSFEYLLTAYHREILRVVADYCDMPLGYCCVKQPKLAVECGMSRAELQRSIEYLIEKQLLHRATSGKLNRYRIGEKITGISNDETGILDNNLPEFELLSASNGGTYTKNSDANKYHLPPLEADVPSSSCEKNDMCLQWMHECASNRGS